MLPLRLLLASESTQRQRVRSLALCAMTEHRPLICFGRDVLPDAATHLSSRLALKINRRKPISRTQVRTWRATLWTIPRLLVLYPVRHAPGPLLVRSARRLPAEAASRLLRMSSLGSSGES